MGTRRSFIHKSILGTAGLIAGSTQIKASPYTPHITANKIKNNHLREKFKPGAKFGLGGVAAGNGFHVNSDEQIAAALAGAWDAGVRHFDTSPWYGLGLSERRMGRFLYNKDREDYIISSKVGRILIPDPDFSENPGIWKGKINMNYKYDYSAAGVRKSVEDSLHRLGLPYLDIVYIHDLSPDNGDMEDNWLKYFEEAKNGAMPELTKMREEGLIKAWGLGVNTVEPILKTIEVADPDIFLMATQYSLMHHKDGLNEVFPVCEKEGISLVLGAALNAGFLAGKERFNYGDSIPGKYLKKRKKIEKIAQEHEVDLRTAALQFAAAPEVVASVIPGASTADQAVANVESMETTHLHSGKL